MMATCIWCGRDVDLDVERLYDAQYKGGYCADCEVGLQAEEIVRLRDHLTEVRKLLKYIKNDIGFALYSLTLTQENEKVAYYCNQAIERINAFLRREDGENK